MKFHSTAINILKGGLREYFSMKIVKLKKKIKTKQNKTNSHTDVQSAKQELIPLEELFIY